MPACIGLALQLVACAPGAVDDGASEDGSAITGAPSDNPQTTAERPLSGTTLRILHKLALVRDAYLAAPMLDRAAVPPFVGARTYGEEATIVGASALDVALPRAIERIVFVEVAHVRWAPLARAMSSSAPMTLLLVLRVDGAGRSELSYGYGALPEVDGRPAKAAPRFFVADGHDESAPLVEVMPGQRYDYFDNDD